MRVRRWLFPVLLGALAVGCADLPTPTSPLEPARSANACTNIPGSVRLDSIRTVAAGRDAAASARLFDTGDCAMSFVGTLQWSTTNANVGYFPTNGDASGNNTLRTVAQGSALAILKVTSGNIAVADTVPFQVLPAPVLTTIVLTPHNPRASVGEQVAFSAAGIDQYGVPMGAVAASWSLDNPAVGSFLAPGVVKALAPGTTVVRAENGGVAGRTTLTVTHGISVTGPDYARDESFTVTASVLPAGTYHYSWAISECLDGVPGCNGPYSTFFSGTNVTSVNGYMPRWAIVKKYRVEVRQVPGGPVLATGFHAVQGAGEDNPNGACTGFRC